MYVVVIIVLDFCRTNTLSIMKKQKKINFFINIINKFANNIIA